MPQPGKEEATLADPEKVGAGGTAAEFVTVGRQLRAARQQANLSIAQIAQALKFSPRQIEALEADDHAALPGNTIVRGFIRSYGRLLKLDVDALLHALDVSTPSAPADVRPPDNMGVANQPGETPKFSPMMSVAIVLFLVAALLGAWHFLGPGITKSGTAANRQHDAAATPATAATTVLAPLPAAPSPAPPLPAENPSPGAASGSTAVAAAVAPAPPPGASLRFVFHDRSWLEVVDATKQKLHSGENLAGSRLTLAGRPPFEVVVGNAARVTLTYGERTVDLAPYTRADVARLTLE